MNLPVKPRKYHSPLRAEQSAATRRRILDAAISLMAGGRQEVIVGEVAVSAGVSERTIYNHFGSADGLVEAVSDHLAEVVLPDPPFSDPESLVASVRAAWRLTPEQEVVLRATPQLAARTKRARYSRVRAALEPLTSHLDEREARVALAGLFAVRGGAAFLALRDEHGATAEEAADAMAWLLQLGIDDLRARNDAARRRTRRRRGGG
jgi:AcrR family transcriptional regulator